MIVVIGDNVYDMTESLFNAVVDSILGIKKARYFIYCVEATGVHTLVNEFYENEEEFAQQLLIYRKLGFNVHFIKEGDKLVEHHL